MRKLMGVLLMAAMVALGLQGKAEGRDGPFILGADISWVPEDEAEGAEYFDKGVKKDIFDILQAYKFNYVRLRVFVNPSAPGGYAAGKKEAWCDIEHLKAMAKRAKAHGMGILVSIHYSDTWTNPESHPKPAAWKDLPFDKLTEAVKGHTRDVVKGLKDQGTPAGMVAIGNEITHGMLWPEGRVWSQIPTGNATTDAAQDKKPGLGNYDQLAALLKAGIEGAKEVDPEVKIMVHHSLGRHNGRMAEWLENLVSRGVEFEVIGMSCYAQRADDDWKNNFTDLSQKYLTKQFVAVEYSGQKRLINDLVNEITNEAGMGTFIWEPMRHREALFNKGGVNAGGGANPAIVGGPAAPAATAPAVTSHGGKYEVNEWMELYPKMAKDYGN